MHSLIRYDSVDWWNQNSYLFISLAYHWKTWHCYWLSLALNTASEINAFLFFMLFSFDFWHSCCLYLPLCLYYCDCLWVPHWYSQMAVNPIFSLLDLFTVSDNVALCMLIALCKHRVLALYLVLPFIVSASTLSSR